MDEKALSAASVDSLGEFELAVRLIDYEGMHTLTSNGFPVDRLPVMGTTTNQTIVAGLNTALVGEGNVASVRVEPYLQQIGGRLSIGTVEMKAWVQRDVGNQKLPGTKVGKAEVDSAYRAWCDRVRKQWERYLRETKTSREALDSMRMWTRRHPLTVSTTFDNEAGPDFSEIFEEAPRLADTPATRKRLTDYAMRLRDWMAEKDTSALFEEFRFRYAQEYILYDTEGSVEENRKWLRGNVVMEDPMLAFRRDDIQLRRWCEGRVWELTRNGEPLFREEGEAYRKVYVAQIDGDLKVVR